MYVLSRDGMRAETHPEADLSHFQRASRFVADFLHSNLKTYREALLGASQEDRKEPKKSAVADN